MHSLTNMVSGSTIAIPTFSSQTLQGYYVYPDASGYSPSLSDIFAIAAAPSSGNL